MIYCYCFYILLLVSDCAQDKYVLLLFVFGTPLKKPIPRCRYFYCYKMMTPPPPFPQIRSQLCSRSKQTIARSCSRSVPRNARVEVAGPGSVVGWPTCQTHNKWHAEWYSYPVHARISHDHTTKRTPTSTPRPPSRIQFLVPCNRQVTAFL